MHLGCGKDPLTINLRDFDKGICQSNNTNYGVDLYFALVNNENKIIDSFRLGENASFKYYLMNNSDSEITYAEPCPELLDLLHVYKKNSVQENQYTFIGQPSMYCLAIGKFSKLKSKLAVEFNNIYINSDINWPEMKPGSYFVGDTIRLFINDKKFIYSKRVYFKIYL